MPSTGPTSHTGMYTSCKYPSSGQNKLYYRAIEFSRPLQASVRSFISIHQVAAATVLLLILLMRAWFIVICQVSLAWILYTTRIDKWPWPWLKHSLGQHETLCQVWSWSAQPFSQPSATHRQTDRHIAFYMLDVCGQNLLIINCRPMKLTQEKLGPVFLRACDCSIRTKQINIKNTMTQAFNRWKNAIFIMVWPYYLNKNGLKRKWSTIQKYNWKTDVYKTEN